jgi:ribonuclease Y
VNKVRKDVEQTIKQAGEEACFDADIHNLHPELVKTLGRLKYRTSYGQNVLNHSLEVAYIASMLATEIGANAKIAKRAGLLHDIGKAIDHEVDGTHVSIGVELAKKYKESDAVIHCIQAHHNDVEPQTIEAVLVQAADTISSARPGARRESLENYIKRLQDLENIATSFDGIDTAFAIQAGREVRVMVKPEEVDDARAQVLARDIAQKIEKELEYPGQIKVYVIRESRFSDTAK